MSSSSFSLSSSTSSHVSEVTVAVGCVRFFFCFGGAHSWSRKLCSSSSLLECGISSVSGWTRSANMVSHIAGLSCFLHNLRNGAGVEKTHLCILVLKLLLSVELPNLSKAKFDVIMIGMRGTSAAGLLLTATSVGVPSASFLKVCTVSAVKTGSSINARLAFANSMKGKLEVP